MIEKNIDKKLANRIMDWEGGGVQIREGSKYTVTPAQNVRDFW